MLLDEAISIIRNKYPDFKLISVVDYDMFFVFNIVPFSHDVNRDGEWLGGLTAVDKTQKTTMSFNPLDHNPELYVEAANNNIKYF